MARPHGELSATLSRRSVFCAAKQCIDISAAIEHADYDDGALLDREGYRRPATIAGETQARHQVVATLATFRRKSDIVAEGTQPIDEMASDAFAAAIGNPFIQIVEIALGFR